MNSWAVSACYPRRTFYPLSDGPSIQNHRITKTNFRSCSTCRSQSSTLMPLHSWYDVRPYRGYLCAPPLLFGRRPPQSNYPPYTVLNPGLRTKIRTSIITGWYFKVDSMQASDYTSSASHLSYTVIHKVQCKAIVKVHGVFPSSRGYTASSQQFQFH